MAQKKEENVIILDDDALATDVKDAFKRIQNLDDEKAEINADRNEILKSICEKYDVPKSSLSLVYKMWKMSTDALDAEILNLRRVFRASGLCQQRLPFPDDGENDKED